MRKMRKETFPGVSPTALLGVILVKDEKKEKRPTVSTFAMVNLNVFAILYIYTHTADSLCTAETNTRL